MDKYEKLEALLTDPSEVKALFAGSKQDILTKFADRGIDLTEQEFDEMISGMKAALSEEGDELNEEALENVAGGSQKTKDFGRKVGRFLRKAGKVGKWVLDVISTISEL
jgi:hypothetical protein